MELQEELKLIESAKKDPEQFAKLYDHYVASVYRYFFARVGHKELAEDLTSQTFLQALAAIPRFRSNGLPLGPWLFKIAHNLLVNSYRTKKNLPLDEAVNVADKTDMVEQTDRALNIALLQSLMDQLSERDRDIVSLRAFSDLSFEQIAEVLEISNSAARTAYHRAVQKLTNLYTEKGKYYGSGTTV
jgi:RNA polymerase sigma-70 factor (ECF subfamily)